MDQAVYTRCPECHAAFRINVDQLRASQGEVQCERCHTVFNALPSLAMTPKGASARAEAQDSSPLAPILNRAEELPPPEAEEPRPRRTLGELRGGYQAKGPPPPPASGEEPEGSEEEGEEEGFSIARTLFYAGGSLAFAVLLGFQVFAFESHSLAQSPYIRPLLNRVCGTLGCELPPFRDLSRIKIMDRTLNAGEGQRPSLDFSMIFANESGIAQVFPKLKLVLNDVRGQAVAERIFEPSEYLPDWREGLEMEPGRRVEVRLRLVRPEREVSDFAVYPL